MTDTTSAADELRAALDRAAELHELYKGACGTCADETGQAADWPCETATALAVARQVLGTTTGQQCPECGNTGACNGGPCPLGTTGQLETEAHRPSTEWIAEVQEDDGLWMYLGSDPDRSVAEKRRASVTRRHPGVETRTVRKTTTYTVAAEAQQPTPAVAEETK
ncbi:hypothetical protein [Streptomyces sp. NPDC002913]